MSESRVLQPQEGTSQKSHGKLSVGQWDWEKYLKGISPAWGKYFLICSPEYPELVGQPSFLPSPHRYLWPSATHFSLFSVSSRSTFLTLTGCQGCLNAYENWYRNALKASVVGVKIKPPTDEKQQRGQSPNRSRRVPTHRGLTENIKARKNWLGHGSGDPKAGAPCTVTPHLSLWRVTPFGPKPTDSREDQRSFCSAPYQPVPIIKQEITFMGWIRGLSIQGKMRFLRKWKALIYPEILLGRNSVVFECRWEPKDAAVLHSSLY